MVEKEVLPEHLEAAAKQLTRRRDVTYHTDFVKRNQSDKGWNEEASKGPIRNEFEDAAQSPDGQIRPLSGFIDHWRYLRSRL